MKKKSVEREYESPRVIGGVFLEMEGTILAGSVVNSINTGGVKSSSQTVEEHDASEYGFNHDWN